MAAAGRAKAAAAAAAAPRARGRLRLRLRLRRRIILIIVVVVVAAAAAAFVVLLATAAAAPRQPKKKLVVAVRDAASEGDGRGSPAAPSPPLLSVLLAALLERPLAAVPPSPLLLSPFSSSSSRGGGGGGGILVVAAEAPGSDDDGDDDDGRPTRDISYDDFAADVSPEREGAAEGGGGGDDPAAAGGDALEEEEEDEEDDDERCQWSSSEEDEEDDDESCEYSGDGYVETEEDGSSARDLEAANDARSREESDLDDGGADPSPHPRLLRLTLEAFTSAESYRGLFETTKKKYDEDDNDDEDDESEQQPPPRRSLVLALVHDESCPHSRSMLDRFGEAARHVQDATNLRLGVLALEGADSSLRALFGVDRVPALLFLSWLDETDSVVLIEYNGLADSPQDIAHTARHYCHRLVEATAGWELSRDMVHVRPPHYKSCFDLQDYLRQSRALDPRANPRVAMPLPPTLAPGDVRFARWLLEEEQDEEQGEEEEPSSPPPSLSLPDDSKVFVQCRRRHHNSSYSSEAHRMFDQASRAMSNRRDCFFATVDDCGPLFVRRGDQEEGDAEEEDGTVAAFSIPYDWDYENRDFVTTLDPVVLRHASNSINATHGGQATSSASSASASASSLIHDMALFARPSVLWFDRQATAPIVFGYQQKLHAVLVVDMHPVITSPSSTRLDDMRAVRSAFVTFRRACRKHRQVACLVVPSTETRVLVALGVDIWTPMDEQAVKHRSMGAAAAEQEEGLRPRPLPAVILTDRGRVPGKTLTYVLDRDRLLSAAATHQHSSAAASPQAVERFFDDFVAHRLAPRIRSDPRGPRTNAAGVRILTGASVRELLNQDDDRHALVLFVAPTCGHCKRAAVMWDRLSQFLRTVGWSPSLVKLYRMDVSDNEVPDGVSPRWLPDAYYYHPASGNFTRFDWIQDDGGHDESGGRAAADNYDSSSFAAPDWDVTTLLDWFVSVARLTDGEVAGLLRELER